MIGYLWRQRVPLGSLVATGLLLASMVWLAHLGTPGKAQVAIARAAEREGPVLDHLGIVLMAMAGLCVMGLLVVAWSSNRSSLSIAPRCMGCGCARGTAHNACCREAQ